MQSISMPQRSQIQWSFRSKSVSFSAPPSSTNHPFQDMKLLADCGISKHMNARLRVLADRTRHNRHCECRSAHVPCIEYIFPCCRSASFGRGGPRKANCVLDFQSRFFSRVWCVAPIRFFSNTFERARRLLNLHEVPGSFIALLPVAILALILSTGGHSPATKIATSIFGQRILQFNRTITE